MLDISHNQKRQTPNVCTPGMPQKAAFEQEKHACIPLHMRAKNGQHPPTHTAAFEGWATAPLLRKRLMMPMSQPDLFETRVRSLSKNLLMISLHTCSLNCAKDWNTCERRERENAGAARAERIASSLSTPHARSAKTT